MPRWPDRTPEERFWRFVDKSAGPNGCWGWRGHLLRRYGAIKIGGRTVYAHRVSYEANCGPIPSGLFVCHKCDNPPCTNPDHLFLGTHSDNMRDKYAKGRHDVRGEKHPQTKLSNADIVAIRCSTQSREILGNRYGISRTQVSRIRSRDCWSHVP